MNETGLRNYLEREASDDELILLAQEFGEANRYDDFVLFTSLNEIAADAGWDPEQLAWQLEGVDRNADYFRYDGYANLESLSQEELVDEIKTSFLDGIVSWVDAAPGYVLSSFSDDVKGFLDQEDPYETLKSIRMTYQDMGPAEPGAPGGPDPHRFDVTLSNENGSFHLDCFCPANVGDYPMEPYPVKAEIIDSILSDYAERYYAQADFDPDEEAKTPVGQRFESLKELLGDCEPELMLGFLTDVHHGEYPSISWDDLSRQDSPTQPLSGRIGQTMETSQEVSDEFTHSPVDLDKDESR